MLLIEILISTNKAKAEADERIAAAEKKIKELSKVIWFPTKTTTTTTADINNYKNNKTRLMGVCRRGFGVIILSRRGKQAS